MGSSSKTSGRGVARRRWTAPWVRLGASSVVVIATLVLGTAGGSGAATARFQTASAHGPLAMRSEAGLQAYLPSGARRVGLPVRGREPAPGEGPDLPLHGPLQGAVAHSLVSGATTRDEWFKNWSGLVDLGAPYSAVAGHWTVPAVQASQNPRLVTDWVGIGGFASTKRLIQTGTTSESENDRETYDAWYELLPAPPVLIGGPVSPGDEMAAAVRQTGSQTWDVAIEDVTDGWVATGTVSYTAGPATSAEWITERPTTTGTRTLDTLGDYGSTRFFDLRVAGQDAGAGTLTYAYMISTTRRIISSPSAYATTTTGTFTDSYGTPPPTVTSLSPSRGSVLGGTTVEIVGTFLVPGLVDSVHFGPYPAQEETVHWNGTITVTAPAAPAGVVFVTVTTTDGTSAASIADEFTYETPVPTAPASATPAPTAPAPSTQAPHGDTGYDLVGADGGVFVFDAPGETGGFYGSLPGIGVVPAKPIVGMVATASNQGYLLVGADGGVFAFGDAPFYGSLPGIGVHVDDIVGIAATGSDDGYWLVASSGKVYAFGAAKHLGTAPAGASGVSGIAGTPTGDGYWITTRSGAVYAFGDAKGLGTLPALRVAPHLGVVGIVPSADGGGYWLLGADGGVFAFGDAPFYGSLPGIGVHVGDIVAAVPN